MKKFLIIIAIILGVWFYFNPIGKISKVSKGLIIYSGVPILNLDLIIKPNGHFLLSDHSYDKIDHLSLVKEISANVLNVNGKYDYVVIGQGVGKNKIKISSELLDFFRSRGVKIYKGSSYKMMEKYNKLKENKKNILAIFSTGFPREDIERGFK